MIRKIPLQKLKELQSKEINRISDHDKDEMAIPAYLHWNPLIRWLMWRRYEYISDLCEFSSDMAVLEFGCGLGVFLPELASKCKKVYAIDLFPEYAKILCEELSLKVCFKDNIKEIKDSSLDIIIAADVFEHLDENEIKECMIMFSKKLKRYGRLIVSGPTENIIYRIGRVFAGFADKGDYHHTNINKLVDLINETFDLQRVNFLPFTFPPHLFKICEFKQPEH